MLPPAEFAADREPGRVDAECRAVRRNPFHGCKEVFPAGREIMFRRQPVAHRDRHAIHGARDGATDRIRCVQSADDEAAAMAPKERGSGLAGGARRK